MKEISDNDDDMNGGGVDAIDVVSHRVWQLFNLGRALNVPRGALVRLSTEFRSMASAGDQWIAAIKAEESALNSAVKRASQIQSKAVSNER